MKVADCWVHPIKSLAGFKVPRLTFDQKGPEEDRRFMLVDDRGKFVTQRQKSQLSQVNVQPEPSAYLLTSPDGTNTLRLNKIGAEGKRIPSRVWEDALDLYDQGDEAARFFSTICEQSVRLVYQSAACQRSIDPDYDNANREVSLADGFPVLLINQASIDVLTNDYGRLILPERFRANILVSGLDAFEENTFREITIGEQVFEVVKPCSRCVIPTIDPKTGIKEPKVWQTLKKHCLGEDGQIYFGQNLIPKNRSQVRQGDAVFVVERQ
ncbi:MAG: MOSC domain-containing protein [Cellvibrionales bacterium]|nr:MOSC domain-containing protein [Cellvibrionales bacterium]